MKFKRRVYILLAAMLGFASALVLVGLVNVSSALAEGQTGISSVQQQPPSAAGSTIRVTAFFSDEESVSIMDLSGNLLGEGVHGGEVRCKSNSNCNHSTQLLFTIPQANTEYEYKFETWQTIDPDAESVVVSGNGTLSINGQKERFLFTASFQDNRNGTITVRYEASRPDASFIIPDSPGRMIFWSQ